MRYCKYCGCNVEDGEKFCRNCGAKMDDPQQSNESGNQSAYNPNYNPYTYNQPAAPPKKKKDNTHQIIIAVVAIAVVLVVVAAFVLPCFVTVEEEANYNVKMVVTNVSIEDPDNGFQYAEKDSSERLHTYLTYSCNGSAETNHELGWCKTDGTKMIISDDKRTVSFDVYSTESSIKVNIYLVVVTKVVDGKNHYDYIDLYDVTKYISGEKPTGVHDYGATGVSIKLSDLDKGQIILNGDSNPKGTMTLTFSVTKK